MRTQVTIHYRVLGPNQNMVLRHEIVAFTRVPQVGETLMLVPVNGSRRELVVGKITTTLHSSGSEHYDMDLR